MSIEGYRRVGVKIAMQLRFVITFCCICVMLSGCTGDSQEKEDYLLRVNDFAISKDEIESRLKFEAELDSNFYPSKDTRVELVNALIQSQLLIQEAKKQNFDQREAFRQSIQLYWESTLIRDLLAEKGEQLRRSTVVNQEEIEAYYQENKEFLPEGTLEELKPELVKNIEAKKVNARLAAWIEDLKAGATIEIRDPELTARASSRSSDG